MSLDLWKRVLKEDHGRIVELIVAILTLIIAAVGYAKVVEDEITIAFLSIYLAGLAVILIVMASRKSVCVLCIKRKPVFYTKVIADKTGKYLPICSQHFRLLQYENLRLHGRLKVYTYYDGEKFVVPEDSELRK